MRRPKTNKEMMLKLNEQRRVTIEGCWIWTGTVNSRKYGLVMYKGFRWRIHRLSFYLYKPEEYKDYLVVCHKCDVPLCFNPNHLFIGTQQDNMKDCMEKGNYSNQQVTHCPKGHIYDFENTYIAKDNSRHCRACQRINNMFRRYAKI